MKNKYELMGHYVQVKAFMKPSRKFQRREHTKYDLKEPRVGMVVGYRTVYDGKVVPGIYDPEDYNSGYLSNITSIKVLLVCFWPTYKPVLVLPEDIERVFIIGGEYIDIQGDSIKGLHPSFYPYSDKDREVLRQYAAEMKRDAKGRWIK
jgi:hypothetical protein